tara:strand:- start:3302 stop:5212 length:1911 start_codon:yes stop_codon:yes gene_type:complete
MAITKPNITNIETDPYGVPTGRIRVTKTDDPNRKVGGGGGGRGMGGGGKSGGGRSNPKNKNFNKDLQRSIDLSYKGYESPQQLMKKNLQKYGTTSGKLAPMKITVKKRNIDYQKPVGNFVSSSGRVVKTSGGSTPQVTKKFIKTENIKSQVMTQTDNFQLKVKPKTKSTAEKDLSRILGIKTRVKNIEQIGGTKFPSQREKFSPTTIKSNLTDPVTGQPLTMVRTQSATSTQARLQQGSQARQRQVENFKKAQAQKEKMLANARTQSMDIKGQKVNTQVKTQIEPIQIQPLSKTNLAPVGMVEVDPVGVPINQKVNFEPEIETNIETAQKTGIEIAPSLKDANKQQVQIQEYTGDPMQEQGQQSIVLPKRTVEVQEFTGQAMEGSNRFGLFKEQVKPDFSNMGNDYLVIGGQPKIEIKPVVTPQIVKEKVEIEPVVIPKIEKEKVEIEQVKLDPIINEEIKIDRPIKEGVSKEDYKNFVNNENGSGGGGGNTPPPPPGDKIKNETPPPPPPPPGGGDTPKKKSKKVILPKNDQPPKEIELKPGEFPEVIAHRQGIVEREINTNTGDVKVGKDLHEEVPNDPKIKPKDSVRVISTTESQPRNLEGQLTKSLFYRYDNTDAKRPKVVFFRRPGAKSKR